MKILVALTASLLLLSGCEGYKCATGRVRDSRNNLPLDSSVIEVLTAQKFPYVTDSTGRFEVCNQMGGCVLECKDIKIRITHSGYKTRELENPVDETILLEKQ